MNVRRYLLPAAFGAVWAIALVGSLYALWRLDNSDGSTDDKAGRIAQVASAQGDVQFRDEDALVWLSAQEGRGLRQGNHLATGDDGQAKVVFIDGRVLLLGKHTRIILSEETHDGQTTSVVTLLDGTLRSLPASKDAKTKARPAATANLIVRAAGQSLALKSAHQVVQITKPRAGALQIAARTLSENAPSPAKSAVQPAPPANTALPAATPKVASADGGDKALDRATVEAGGAAASDVIDEATASDMTRSLAPVSSAVVAAMALPKPALAQSAPAASVLAKDVPIASANPAVAQGLAAKPATAAAAGSVAASGVLPRFTANGLEARLADLGPGRSFWTTTSLHEPDARLPDLTLLPPPQLPPDVRWTPFITVSSAGQARVTVEGTAGGQAQILRVPLAKLLADRPSSTWQLDVTLTIGAKIVRGGDAPIVLQIPGPTLHCASLADLETSGPMELRLEHSGDTARAIGAGWSAVPPAGTTAPLTLFLSNSRDIARLLPLLRSAAGLSVVRNAAPSAQPAATFVRNNHIIAVASGRDAQSDSQAADLGRLLNAPLAFRGRPVAFLAQPGAPNFLTRIAAHHMGSRVYVYDNRPGEGRYVMSGHTLAGLGNADIADYVNAGALGIFSEPVDLIPVQLVTAH